MTNDELIADIAARRRSKLIRHRVAQAILATVYFTGFGIVCAAGGITWALIITAILVAIGGVTWGIYTLTFS